MKVNRFIGATVGAAVLSIGLSGVVSAQTGQTGNYIFVDALGTPGAVCRYDRVTDSRAKIYRINVRAPQVWWPDRSADSNTEHGRVGWRFFVQHTNAGPGWVALKRSGFQYATAYEGYPGAYDLADKAPFTSMAVDIAAKNLPAGDEVQVVVKAVWFKKDGTQLGSITHVVDWYAIRVGSDPSPLVQDLPCPKNVFFA